MTALSFRPDAPDAAIPGGDEPVALLQLDLTNPVEAASAVYREIRRGRRVVAVACGGAEAPLLLARALDAIGVDAVPHAPGESLVREGATIVPGPATAPTPSRPVGGRPLRVALAGCGVVGGGVAARLLADPRFELVGVLVRNPDRRRDVATPRELLLTDPAALLAREPDILVEAISDASTGLALIRAALARGVDVVSANKQAVGADLVGLAALSAAAEARLAYSACVGGGAPLVEAVRRARAHGEIVLIEGVLNGTCNYVLERLAEGEDFDTALAEARAAGFAEEDSSADLSGRDAAAKLAILAHAAGMDRLEPRRLPRAPLSAELPSGSARQRQVARLDLRTGEAAIVLRACDSDPLFAELPDEWNALRVVTADGRVFVAGGRGAGRTPTVESLWADLIDLTE